MTALAAADIDDSIKRKRIRISLNHNVFLYVTTFGADRALFHNNDYADGHDDVSRDRLTRENARGDADEYCAAAIMFDQRSTMHIQKLTASSRSQKLPYN